MVLTTQSLISILAMKRDGTSLNCMGSSLRPNHSFGFRKITVCHSALQLQAGSSFIRAESVDGLLIQKIGYDLGRPQRRREAVGRQGTADGEKRVQ